MTNNNKTDKTLTTTNEIVMPAVNAEQAIKAWEQYQDLKKAIVDKDVDVQIIEGKEFLKKSYWRKVATFFNLTIEIVSESHEQVGRTIVWHFTCKVIAPNGRSSIGTGSCDAFEKAKLAEGRYVRYNKFSKKWEDAIPNSIHNIRATAETRAFNRAVSNLVGGGEVSAEEVVVSNGHQEGEEEINVDEVDKAINKKA